MTPNDGNPAHTYPEVAAGKPGGFSENELVEQPAIELLGALGWQTIDLFEERHGPDGTEGRLSRRDAFLPRRLRAAIRRLNPDLGDEAVDKAVEALTRDRSAMLPVVANREVYELLKEGVPVKTRDANGLEVPVQARMIDWRDPVNNDFVIARQLWVTGDLYTRRCDLVGFVNGIPLLLFELKATHRAVQDAFDGNLADYLTAIPQLFWPNALVVLSNGADTRLGSAFAPWEHYFEWKRADDEDEPESVSLETVVRGLCRPDRFLDYVENFVVFQTERGGLIKKIARNHQYLGVNRAIAAVRDMGSNRGRLGVFWHTQGAGKSLSMVYFAQKVLRTLPGNWTFLVVTDRQELDDQITGTFIATGAVTKAQADAQAQSRDHLKQLLAGDERYIFTLIQKFGTAQGETYPKLSDRPDIIVITDEAHRSQYDILAMNMRQALPNAAFIGFTGTPLMAGEEKTRDVFGDYVSIYNFARSIEDRATVPLYYENRIPELQIANADLGEDLERLIEAAELDPEQERRLQREFARQYHLITRDDRLDRIAEDVVRHFTGRGHRGKAMMICIDKATAVRMYDKLQAHWHRHVKELERREAKASPAERHGLRAMADWMRGTDMAVVVSQSQNEIADMAAKGLDIVPHRRRLVQEDLAEKFKNPADPLRLVFVCAMWITGFDVPACSTIYLDKPMKNHSLMQAIARANRVAPGKEAGLIVDYVGVFRELERALAIYARSSGGDSPIKDKALLVERLRQVTDAALAYCAAQGVTTQPILEVEGFARAGAIQAAVDRLLGSDEIKRRFLQHAGEVWTVYKTVLPDPRAGPFAPDAVVLHVLAERIRSLMPKPDIAGVMQQVEELLDQSIVGVAIAAPILPDDELDKLFDLSRIDFERLATALEGGRQRSKVQALRVGIERKLQAMVRRNPTRADLLNRLQRLIDTYNAGSVSAEEMLRRLLDFVKALDDEDKRALREGLTEEELAIFDLLSRPDPVLTPAEATEVKKIAKALLAKLKREKLVLDWRKKEQVRADVRRTIEIELDDLPPVYGKDIYDRKCGLVYQFVFEHYPDGGGGGG